MKTEMHLTSCQITDKILIQAAVIQSVYVNPPLTRYIVQYMLYNILDNTDQHMKPLDVKIAIYEAHVAALIPRKCTALDVADIVGCTSRQAGRYMKQMGFRLISKRKHRSKAGELFREPAVYERPHELPAWAKVAKRCRDQGLSIGQTERAIKQAAELERVLNNAVDSLLADGILLNKRGVLMREIRKVMREMLNEVIPIRDVARALGERTDSSPAALLNKIEMYKRRATTQSKKGV